jgi:DNA polymerase-1
VLSRLSGEFAQCRGLGRKSRSWRRAAQPGSPKQPGDILPGKMGLSGGTKTKTGQWSTGARALEELAEQATHCRKISTGGRCQTQVNLHRRAPAVNPDTHRAHTSYALAATTTGRLVIGAQSAEHSIRTEEGRKAPSWRRRG